jgi:hypothetical protein
MKIHNSRRRGTSILFVVSATFVSTAFCGVVIGTSLESYAVSARLEHRLQARAGAEGAATLVANEAGTSPATVWVGNVEVFVTPTGETDRTLTAIVHAPETGRELYRADYFARFSVDANDRWQIEGVDKP